MMDMGGFGEMVGIPGTQQFTNHPPPPRRNAGLWCVSTRCDQHKEQKEMWLISAPPPHQKKTQNYSQLGRNVHGALAMSGHG